jgi:hypothetical protein
MDFLCLLCFPTYTLKFISSFLLISTSKSRLRARLLHRLLWYLKIHHHTTRTHERVTYGTTDVRQPAFIKCKQNQHFKFLVTTSNENVTLVCIVS